MINLPWKGFEKIAKTEAHGGMAERLARYLAIEGDIQIEIKATMAHTTQ